MSIFRKEYRPLTEAEQQHISDIKLFAESLHGLCSDGKYVFADQRCAALARTKLEECVMWAVKGITG